MLDLLIVFTGQACGSSSPILHPISTEESTNIQLGGGWKASQVTYTRKPVSVYTSPNLMMSTLGAIVSTQMERPKNRRKRDFGPSWRTAYVVRAVMTAVEHLQLHRIHQHLDVDPVRRRRISSKLLRHCCCAVQFGRDDADGLPTAIYLKLSSSF
jgi:hypothetical protein